MIFKKKLKLKNYLVVVLFALNSDIVMTLVAISLIPLILFIINQNALRDNFYNILKILLIFTFFMFLANSNLIFAQLYSEPFHREEFSREHAGILYNIYELIFSLFKIPSELSWTLFYRLPFFIFLLPLIILSFFSKNKTTYLILALLLSLHIFLFLLNTEFIINFRNNSQGLFKTFQIEYVKTIFPFLYVLLFLFVTIDDIKFKKILIYCGLFSVLLFQINSSLVPIGKKFFMNSNKEYKNIYTFKGYYSYDEYLEIKNIVKDQRVLSVGIDPMIANVNDIKSIDGYHGIYPLRYKSQFRKVIEKELENNEKIKKYYDKWGSRVYAFVSNSENVQINFKEAKKIGAEYVISKFELNSDELILRCVECRNSLFLYQIR